jgi:hypothetical protein
VLGLGNIKTAAALLVMKGKALLMKQLGAIDAFPLVVNAHKASDIIQFVTNVTQYLQASTGRHCYLYLFEVEEALQKLISLYFMTISMVRIARLITITKTNEHKSYCQKYDCYPTAIECSLLLLAIFVVIQLDLNYNFITIDAETMKKIG